MPLDKETLKNTLTTTMHSAKDQSWSIELVAAALANAIDIYVRSGDVVQVTVQVKDNANNILGTGAQTGVGKIQ